MTLTLVPAYGRDYRSAKAAREAFEAGKDWLIATMFHKDCGRYCNLAGLQSDGKVSSVNLRYSNRRKLTVVSVPKGGAHEQK